MAEADRSLNLVSTVMEAECLDLEVSLFNADLGQANVLRDCVQIVSESMGEAFVRLRLKDQAKSLAMIGEDAQLADLRQLRAPLVDYEVRGLPALTYFGGMVWRDAIDEYAEGALMLYTQVFKLLHFRCNSQYA